MIKESSIAARPAVMDTLILEGRLVLVVLLDNLSAEVWMLLAERVAPKNRLVVQVIAAYRQAPS
jgi:hypothetical protein